MQLKGLVRVFTAALILISLYQLSFTWFVRRHESGLEDKAKRWVNANYVPAAQKYPGNKDSQALYNEERDEAYKNRLRKLKDSTRDTKLGFGVTYNEAKEKELNLGLDLQGGMAVTLEVGLDGLIRSLSNSPKDVTLNKAIEEANREKANSNADFVTLFAQAYKKLNPGGKMSGLFANSNRNKLKIDASDEAVISYIKGEAGGAIKNTYNVLSKRIDQFGVAQPTITLDQNKGIINVELAGASDPTRVRKYLQATAKLQFWEMYTSDQIGQSLQQADKKLEEYLNGIIPTDSTAKTPPVAKVDTAGKKTDSGGIDAFLKNNNNTNKGTGKVSNPFQSLLKGNVNGYYLASVSLKDTGTLSEYMNMPAFKDALPADLKFLYGHATDKDGNRLENELGLYPIKLNSDGSDKAKLEGEHVKDAAQDYDQVKVGEVIVRMAMDKQGTKIWADMTTKNKDRPIAIVLDDFVYSAPRVNDPITNGESLISGNFTVQEAQDLSNILKSGKLEAPAKIVQDQVVGPTLGQEAIRGGSLAFFISFIVIFILMLVYYNTAGWVANIALILNLLFTIGVLSNLHASLTAAGIAGLVLTIGMAVDTNVIIFERIKEELTRGKSYQQAVSDGYKRSLAPVLDAHVTTFLTAFILFIFGLGPVLGFATTQMIGIVLSLLCGILVSRMITDWWTNKKRHFEYFTAVSRRIFRHANFKFIEYRKVAYMISIVVLLLGLGAIWHGFKEGVEFSGGRSYTVKFRKDVNADSIRNQLKNTFGSYPIVKTVGSNLRYDITTDYRIKDPGQSVDSAVEYKLFEGLKPFLPEGLTFREFDTQFKQGSKTVLPTISDDLKSGAKWATFWSLLIITIYIFIRFRDWRYSVGTLVALLHDVLVTLAVFSFLQNVVPFPLEIDQHFIAAILTVIGFSMNDTVIVFDRIREYSRTMKGADKRTIINKAINDTLSRTIMTSLTVFLTILILFIFGGEVTRGFAFAMLVGVVTGTYSSIFVAAPILVDFAKNKPLGDADIIPHAEKPAKATPVSTK